MMLVQYSCGCMGIPFDDKGNALILDQCDDPDGDSATIHIRDMDGKESEPLTESQSKEIIRNVGSLVGDGYRFREVKRLLNG